MRTPEHEIGRLNSQHRQLMRMLGVDATGTTFKNPDEIKVALSETDTEVPVNVKNPDAIEIEMEDSASERE